ncbi:pyruvate dehydrogenase E2 component (dihydrolipoamide acetyltransferase) [Alteromonadaceae bacterium 2753L.S.0a.02]|nr:pyruvate dehydrogenase E2 component (dihydrolipoamide acetyltransferase) [Alteromonadaceae bacterium 2753L.S.0a.02]
MFSLIFKALNKAFVTDEKDAMEEESPEVIITEQSVIRVPNNGSQSAEIIEIHAKKGDIIKTDQVLIVLESEKYVLEIPSPYLCKIEEVLVHIGNIVSENDALIQVSPHS